LCEWRIGESNPWPPACKAGALPTELIPHAICDRDGIRTRIFPIDKRALSPLSYTASDVVVRGGIEPPASAVSERRSQPTELPDTGTLCGTRTRSSALKGRETNPYPNGAWCVVPLTGVKPVTFRTSPGRSACSELQRRGKSTVLPRQDSNLNCPEPKPGGLPFTPRGTVFRR
jgi:hypothetical protein